MANQTANAAHAMLTARSSRQIAMRDSQEFPLKLDCRRNLNANAPEAIDDVVR